MKVNQAMLVAYIALVGFVLSTVLRMKIDGISLIFFIIGGMAFFVAVNAEKLEHYARVQKAQDAIDKFRRSSEQDEENIYDID